MTGVRRLTENPHVNKMAVRAADPSVLAYHRSWPSYVPTPLRSAPHAARRLGVASVSVKDESARFGMPSFKILGASWATHRALCSHLGINHEQVPDSAALRALLAGAQLTLVAATDGNHGRAVARMASLLGLTSHILVPEGLAPARVQAIRDEGASVTVIAGGYDVAVAASAALASTSHVVISDTSWAGYELIPGWVIDGYTTLSSEVEAQRLANGTPAFTVAAAQMGVGAFAASVARAHAHSGCRLVGVEPTAADCVIASLEAGNPIELEGSQDSIMAGLNCGTPSPIAWPDLIGGIDTFVAVADEDAEDAMRVLAADGIVSGESGAAGLAGLLGFRTQLALGPQDHVLAISTEGATDPVGYERVVRHEST